MPTEATMLSRSLAASSSSTRPRSTPSVNVAAVTASVMSSVRSWLPSAKRPSAATAFCWRARRASCCAAWVRSVTSRATTSSDSTAVVGGVHRHGLDGERQPVADELEGTPLARQRGAVVLEAELEHLLGDLGVQLGHLAAAEHVGVEEAEAPGSPRRRRSGSAGRDRGGRRSCRAGCRSASGAAPPSGGSAARPRGSRRPSTLRSVTSLAAKYRTPSTATVVQCRNR